MLSKEWYVLFNDFSSFKLWGVTKRLMIGFFNFPDNYYSLILYIKTLPLLTIFSGISLSVYFVFLLFDKDKNENTRFLIGVVIIMSLGATIPDLMYRETRYTFFIAPIVLMLVLYSVHYILSKIFTRQLLVNVFFISLILMAFIISKDFNPYHLIHIDRQDVNYRMIYNNMNYKQHLYRRWDILTPTDYVKKNLGKEDLIMINETGMKFYLPRVDYFNFNYKHRAFSSLSVEKGTREKWSNAKLIYTDEALINFIENRKTTIWFLAYPENWLTELNFYNRYKNNLVYEGIDGVIKVFKFPKDEAN